MQSLIPKILNSHKAKKFVMNYRKYLGYFFIIIIGLIVMVGFIIIGIVGIRSPQ
jgi:hypothetical protein